MAVPSPTQSSVRAEPTQTAPEPSDTTSSEPTETETTAPTQTTPTAPSSPTTSPSVQPSSAETDGTSSWLWWVLLAIVLALAVGVPLLVRARRRGTWRDNLASAEDEVAWFARVLIPQLRQQPSPAEAAGGWNVAESRVIATEDSLTALESSAPDEAAATRARTLRDAVRTARADIQNLLASSTPATMPQNLDAVATQLEQTLAPPPPTD